MTTTIIPLNLIYDYPVNWSRFKTLRDFVQNFFDAVGWQNWSTRFSFEIANNTLTLRATDIGFSYDWLLHIGASTKREGNHAGYFGEGFKIASLCAIRDHGWNVALSSRNWSLKVCSSCSGRFLVSWLSGSRRCVRAKRRVYCCPRTQWNRSRTNWKAGRYRKASH